MNNDFFQLINLDDLPEKVKIKLLDVEKEIDLKSLHKRKIFELFKLKTQLSVNEIVVGLWRREKITKERQSIANALRELSEEGLVKKIKRGVYESV